MGGGSILLMPEVKVGDVLTHVMQETMEGKITSWPYV